MLHPVNVQRMFAKKVSKYFDAKNFILTSVYTWHVGSRCYTPDFQVVIIHTNICPIVATGFNPSAEERQGVTACFTSAPVTNRWLLRCFFRCPNRCKSLGSISGLQGWLCITSQPERRNQLQFRLEVRGLAFWCRITMACRRGPELSKRKACRSRSDVPQQWSAVVLWPWSRNHTRLISLWSWKYSCHDYPYRWRCFEPLYQSR